MNPDLKEPKPEPKTSPPVEKVIETPKKEETPVEPVDDEPSVGTSKKPKKAKQVPKIVLKKRGRPAGSKNSPKSENDNHNKNDKPGGVPIVVLVLFGVVVIGGVYLIIRTRGKQSVGQTASVPVQSGFSYFSSD
jgi:outer membrane biosynthesis protein TonB